MATKAKSAARIAAEDRANSTAGVKTFETFEAAGVGAVRSLELNNIAEGEVVTIPEDYVIYVVPINGTNNTAAKVITEEGKDFWIGALTRSAQPASETDPSKRVKPNGSVNKKVQEYGSMDKAFREALAGHKIKFTKKHVVSAQFGDETRDVNVWDLDFAD